MYVHVWLTVGALSTRLRLTPVRLLQVSIPISMATVPAGVSRLILDTGQLQVTDGQVSRGHTGSGQVSCRSRTNRSVGVTRGQVSWLILNTGHCRSRTDRSVGVMERDRSICHSRIIAASHCHLVLMERMPVFRRWQWLTFSSVSPGEGSATAGRLTASSAAAAAHCAGRFRPNGGGGDCSPTAVSSDGRALNLHFLTSLLKSQYVVNCRLFCCWRQTNVSSRPVPWPAAVSLTISLRRLVNPC